MQEIGYVPWYVLCTLTDHVIHCSTRQESEIFMSSFLPFCGRRNHEEPSVQPLQNNNYKFQFIAGFYLGLGLAQVHLLSNSPTALYVW